MCNFMARALSLLLSPRPLRFRFRDEEEDAEDAEFFFSALLPLRPLPFGMSLESNIVNPADSSCFKTPRSYFSGVDRPSKLCCRARKFPSKKTRTALTGVDATSLPPKSTFCFFKKESQCSTDVQDDPETSAANVFWHSMCSFCNNFSNLPE